MKQPATYLRRLFIGTSNIVLPGNKTTFPPAFHSSSRLHYYAHLFNSVEINQSFYKTPLYRTFQKWSEDVPADFRFSVKMSKAITHEKNLKVDQAVTKEFLKAAAGVSGKKGCLLIQFPGKITLDYYKSVEKILKEIKKRDTGGWKKALEFRHPSWYIRETFELLDEYQSSIVLHDIPKAKIFDSPKNAPCIYIRFHGPAGDYRGSYTDDFLKEKAVLIKKWISAGKEVYVYFNNTIGDAFENARRLSEMLT